MSILNKIKGMLSKNANQVDDAIDKAGDFIDDKTKGKYADKVDKAQDVAKDLVDKVDGDDQPKK